MPVRLGRPQRTLARVVERVSLQEAARRLGVSVRTVQRRIRAGELEAEHVATGRGMRVIVVLGHPLVESETTATGGDTEAPALLTEVRAERDWLRGRVQSLEQTVDRLTVLLAQAQSIAQLPQAGGDTGDTGPAADATVTRQPDVVPSVPPAPSEARQKAPLWRAILRRLLAGGEP